MIHLTHWLGDLPGLSHWSKYFLALYPYLVLWLCSPVTLLAWLFLTFQWFELRFGFCALVLIQPEESFSLEFDKTPARISVSLPSVSLNSLVTSQGGI